MKLRTLGILAAAVAGVALSAGAARADSLDLQPVPNQDDTIQMFITGYSAGTYSYSLYLTSGNTISSTSTASVNPNDFPSGLVVPDIGATAASFAPTALGVNWSFSFTDSTGVATLGLTDTNSVNNTGGVTTVYNSSNPGGVVGSIATTDSSSTDDLVYAVASGSYANTGATRVLLGTGTFTSTITVAQLTSPNELLVSRNIGATGGVQIVDSYNLTAVPVPAAVWTGMSTLLGLAGLGLLRRRRLV